MRSSILQGGEIHKLKNPLILHENANRNIADSGNPGFHSSDWLCFLALTWSELSVHSRLHRPRSALETLSVRFEGTSLLDHHYLTPYVPETPLKQDLYIFCCTIDWQINAFLRAQEWMAPAFPVQEGLKRLQVIRS